jgi:hypothetical protein
MGRMKEFASRLANMVYVQRLTNKQIYARYKDDEIDEAWLRVQVAMIRSQPDIYKPLAGAK